MEETYRWSSVVGGDRLLHVAVFAAVAAACGHVAVLVHGAATVVNSQCSEILLFIGYNYKENCFRVYFALEGLIW